MRRTERWYRLRRVGTNVPELHTHVFRVFCFLFRVQRTGSGHVLIAALAVALCTQEDTQSVSGQETRRGIERRIGRRVKRKDGNKEREEEVKYGRRKVTKRWK